MKPVLAAWILAALAAALPGARAQTTTRPKVRSLISIFDMTRRTVEVRYRVEEHFEAPNWSPDGRHLILNSRGRIYRLAVADNSAPEMLDFPGIEGANNDHGITRDGQWLAISARGPAGGSQIYVAPAGGGTPRLVTPKSPSYFHGWSPDRLWLAYCARRDDNFDLYRISAQGGEEQRLTTHPGYDDGPDYTPDGKWIYFNSDRSGSWDIWRIPAGGAGADDRQAERVTSDEWEDWFPHPSPDGKTIVFLSFAKGTKGHPANQNVLLRTIPAPGRRVGTIRPEVLYRLFGGQGTLNVNSWAPDSRRFAFVSYETY